MKDYINNTKKDLVKINGVIAINNSIKKTLLKNDCYKEEDFNHLNYLTI